MTLPPPASRPSLSPGMPGHARLIYWAFLLGLILPGANVAAAAFAWLARSRADEIIKAHYANQISIFWKSVLYIAAGLALTYFLFGVLLIIAAIIWYILRILRGLKALSAGLPPENPQSWLL